MCALKKLFFCPVWAHRAYIQQGLSYSSGVDILFRERYYCTISHSISRSFSRCSPRSTRLHGLCVETTLGRTLCYFLVTLDLVLGTRRIRLRSCWSSIGITFACEKESERGCGFSLQCKDTIRSLSLRSPQTSSCRLKML